ncbi:nuclear transport factor 2 family protein [Sandaracinobacter neustonicus]|uniref:Nuclear transport factor 2 family protein n=1 Tax=Sandaracinobacter neustonicus TaxID=1715348 RepID=A0A501XFE6_9SPHN|nr:nuclear transport factor 2 family protein [Sandaracinobacter neustonicus]TPE59043.1 nuclear transport factor 2 family protein [Sandaracinobacter neustonicus]
MADTSKTRAALDRWHDYILKSHDKQMLWDMLHPDVVFESPVVHTPQRGRDITFKYLASADKVLGGEGFRYLGEWLSADGAILEFTNTLDGIEVNGVDMIRFDDDGKIINFKVMVRPLKAVNHVHQLMKAQLEAMMSAKAG